MGDPVSLHPLQSCRFPRAIQRQSGQCRQSLQHLVLGRKLRRQLVCCGHTVPTRASGSGPRLAQAASGESAGGAAGPREGAGAAGRRFKRENKNRPAEASSKQRPKRLQEVVEGTKRCAF